LNQFKAILFDTNAGRRACSWVVPMCGPKGPITDRDEQLSI